MTKKIKPEKIPQVLLSNGAKIPVIGLGTFGSDNYTNEQIAEAVKTAVRMGYRHIDCASVYGNEKEIGQVLAEMIQNGEIKREELWITSKVWNNMHGEGDVIKSCRQSLADL
ncbi:MAG: aldo/keto reductase, partial [Prolixibacteraceae bacterium]|nr:aldo/keto reductase [Prolixibacteraceae bacterium]